MPAIVVVGSANLDLIVPVPAIPRPGETVLGGALTRAPGGKGANQAVAARRMGAAVAFVGAVGADDHGRILTGALAADGVQLHGLRSVAGAATGVALIAVAASGENCIIVAPGANALLTPDDVDRAAPAIRSAGMLVTQLEIPLSAVRRALEIARSAGVRTVLNPAPAQPLPDDVLALADVLVLNATEAALLTGQPVADADDATQAAQALRQRGAGLVVVTLGARGAVALGPAATLRMPAFRVPVVDTTAAGDAFIGALATRLSADPARLDSALRAATAAGALCVGRPGAQPSLPTADEVAAFLTAHAQP